MNRHRLLGLALLIGANCLLLGLAEMLLLWLPPDGTAWRGFWFNLFNNVYEGVFTAQFFLIGFWCALAPERLVWRLLSGIVLTGLLLGIYFLYLWTVNPTEIFEVAVEQAGNYCGLALVAFLLLRALRPWFGWRLAWEGTPHRSRSRQFRILDLLAWPAAVAVPLGLLQTLYGGQAARLALVTAAAFAFYLPLTIPALCWAVRPRKFRWLAALLLWGFLWAACLVLLANCGALLFGNTGLLAWRESLMGLVSLSACYLPLVLVWVCNVLALRKLGLRPIAKSSPITNQPLPPPANFTAS
ncbi:MAG: hypothetical protein IAF94_20610 [Pirellulaceae bacterium]|nr:hypothetical protein [Pirellulaceae bacterium]